MNLKITLYYKVTVSTQQKCPTQSLKVVVSQLISAQRVPINLLQSLIFHLRFHLWVLGKNISLPSKYFFSFLAVRRIISPWQRIHASVIEIRSLLHSTVSRMLGAASASASTPGRMRSEAGETENYPRQGSLLKKYLQNVLKLCRFSCLKCLYRQVLY